MIKVDELSFLKKILSNIFNLILIMKKSTKLDFKSFHHI